MEKELNRIKHLMGLGDKKKVKTLHINETTKIKYLNESLGGNKGDVLYYISKGLGFTDETAQILGKNVDDFSEQAKEITQALEKAGLDDIGKLQAKLKSAGNINRTTDLTSSELELALKEYFKQHPEQAKQILMSTTSFTDKVVSVMSIKDIFSKYPDIIEGLEFVVSPQFKLDETNVDVLKNNLMNVINGLDKLPQTGKIKEVTDLVHSKFDAANLMDNFKGSNKKASSNTEDFSKNVNNDDLIKRLNDNGKLNSRGWYEFGPGFRPEEMSGWKFHVFGETLEDSAFLIEKLKPIAEKYSASAKVGGPGPVERISAGNSPEQAGKQGASIYIPQSVINNGQQESMLKDIESALIGYKKGGVISGDKSITPSIHYRYELNGPIKEGDIKTYNDYSLRYVDNTGGPYKPENVNDLFSKSTNKSTNTVSNGFLSSKFGDTSKINWSVIVNAKNISDYDVIIDNAMKTGNFNTITRLGFEEYGIPDFRKYVQNIYNKEKGINSVTPKIDTYKTNRELYDLYMKENDKGPMYDWLEGLSDDEMNDLYKYIEENKLKSTQKNKSSNVNWSDMQPPNQPRSPYERYGAGSN
jgi:hypothetical protein